MTDVKTGESVNRTRKDWSLPLTVRVVIPSSVLAAVVFGFTRPIHDPDTYWHLRTGEWLRDSWQFVGPDPFTDTAAHDWVLHEWLLELIFSWTYDFVGMAGVVWLVAAFIGAVAFTLYLVCRQYASIIVSGLVTAVSVVAMASSLTPRPHLVTYPLLALTVHGWLRSVEDGRPRWWLVTVPWVWAWSHGMWFVGAVVAAMILVGGMFDRALTRRQSLLLTGAWGMSVLVVALGPAGWHVLLSPLQVSEVTRFVTEWQPSSPRHLPFASLLALAGVVVAAWARSAHRVPWRHVAVLAAGVGLLTMGVRFVAVGAAVLAPVAALTIQSAIPFVREKLGRIEAIALTVAAVVGLSASAGLAAKMDNPSTWGPNGLASEIRDLPDGTTVCNEQELGGWLLWNAPQVRPVIDGRLEIYSVPFVERLVRWQVRGEGGAEFAEGLNCTAVLVSSDSPVPDQLIGQGWSRTSEADGYILLEIDSHLH